MVNSSKAKHYHSYTKDVRFKIEDMHPSHIVNALAVIQEGRHRKYYVGDDVFTALVEQLLVSIKANSRKRGLAKKPVKRVATRRQVAQGYPTLSKLREVAKSIVRTKGFVAADSLREVVEKAGFMGLPGLSYCPVFRVKDFVFIGRKPSESPSANGREIRVYILA